MAAAVARRLCTRLLGTDWAPAGGTRHPQAYVSQLKLEGLALTSDMVYVTQSGE